MNLHEYQAKGLFRSYGMPVSDSQVVQSADQMMTACEKIGGNKWVVKAQIHAGGRGKSGGVKLVNTVEEAEAFCNQWLGKKLVTKQTTQDGQPVDNILLESCTDIETELYYSVLMDRADQKITVLASTEGGVDIEAVASQTPEKIHRMNIEPVVGPQPWQGRTLAAKLGFNAAQTKQFVQIFLKTVKMFEEKDLTLIEINPLVITQDGDLHCLDAKVSVDPNALYRQKALAEQNDLSQEDAAEAQAAEEDMSFVVLDGNIGCMVNGAGLAMATMDLIAVLGGQPANFLDVGGRTNAERVAKAFKLILQGKDIKCILVNIFGGIVRCDLIALGIIKAVEEVGLSIPVVVRLEGTNSQIAQKILKENDIENINVAKTLEQAGQLAVELSR